MMAVIAYLAHQASVSYLPQSPVLTQLSSTSRKTTTTAVVQELTAMFYQKKVE